MTAAIQKWGNSLALRIPSAVARELRVAQGDAVELSLEGGALTIRAARSRYQLADLIKGIQKENRHDEADWGEAVGREI